MLQSMVERFCFHCQAFTAVSAFLPLHGARLPPARWRKWKSQVEGVVMDYGMIMAWLWHDDGMIMAWLWHDDGMIMAWLWHDYGMIMAWWWHDDGMMMAWWWHDYGMIMAWLWHDYGMIMVISWRKRETKSMDIPQKMEVFLMGIMWVKQCQKPPIWEWFISPIYGDLGDGLLLVPPHLC